MANELKVYQIEMTHPGFAVKEWGTCIVAATSVTAAAKAMGFKPSYFKVVASVASEGETVAKAMSEPGAVFFKPNRRMIQTGDGWVKLEQ